MGSLWRPDPHIAGLPWITGGIVDIIVSESLGLMVLYLSVGEGDFWNPVVLSLDAN